MHSPVISDGAARSGYQAPRPSIARVSVGAFRGSTAEENSTPISAASSSNRRLAIVPTSSSATFPAGVGR